MSPTIIITGVITLSWLAVIGFHLWLHASDARALRNTGVRRPRGLAELQAELIKTYDRTTKIYEDHADLLRQQREAVITYSEPEADGSGWHADPSGFYTARYWSAPNGWTNRVRGHNDHGQWVERTDPSPLPLDQRYIDDTVAEMDRRLNEVES